MTLEAEGADTKSEKPARAAFFAAVQRLIASDCVVIADGLNYMKVRGLRSPPSDRQGYRYQLYCAAREAKIRTCTARRLAL